jgi:hypothetical protein
VTPDACSIEAAHSARDPLGVVRGRVAVRSVVLALVLAALMATPAAAAVIHAPANGAAVQQDAALFFDWAWDADEYATTGIVFTHSSDPNDPVWTWQAGEPATDPGRRVVVTDGGYSFLSSHATVTFRAAQFAAGTWYWRLCNKSIDIEDDKCSLDAEIRALTVTPKPPSPACSDGIDNDLDGDTDMGDLTCDSESGTTEGPPPQCADGIDNDGDGMIDLSDKHCTRNTDRREGLDPMPRLGFDEARNYMRTALRRRFKAAYRHGYAKTLRGCTRRSRTRVKCRRVSWNIGDLGYDGWATIWLGRDSKGAVWWNYAYRITRTNWYCVDQRRKGCTKVYRVG